MIIFFDIDGTLIDDNCIMPESAKEAIRLARQNGHVCMINTGRSFRMVRPHLQEWGEFDGYLMGCGTHILFYQRENGQLQGGKNVSTDRKESPACLLHQTFTIEESARIMEGLDRYQIDAILEGSENNYMRPLEEMYTDEFRQFARQFASTDYGSFEQAPGRFDKFYCYIGENPRIEEFFQEYADLLDIIDREKGFYEIVPKGFSKASGIDYMVKHLGLSKKDTVAMGDSNNDLTMLMAVNTAIAMERSSEGVLKIADYVTTDVNKDGIYNALKWLGAI